jgi:hypothetical protein
MTYETPELFGARMLSQFAVSHLSDNVIALNYYRDQGSLKRAMTVIKTRASGTTQPPASTISAGSASPSAASPSRRRQPTSGTRRRRRPRPKTCPDDPGPGAPRGGPAPRPARRKTSPAGWHLG